MLGRAIPFPVWHVYNLSANEKLAVIVQPMRVKQCAWLAKVERWQGETSHSMKIASAAGAYA